MQVSQKFSVLLLILSCVLSSSAQARQKKSTPAQQFLKTVRYLARLEKRGVKPDSHAYLEFLLPTANASSKSCIIAGYVGSIKGGSCKFPTDVSYDQKSITCRPEIFGDLNIPKPSDSEWTRDCGNAFLKNAGLAEKSIEDELSADDQKKLSDYMTAKNISMADMKNDLADLCKVAENSMREKDKQDCDDLNAMFAATSPSTATDDENKPQSSATSANTVKTTADATEKPKVNASNPGVVCAPGAVTTKNIIELNDAAQKAEYGFDPNLQKTCRDSSVGTKDDSKYGFFSTASAEEYEHAYKDTGDHKICYEQAFKDKVVKNISAEFQTMKFDAKGVNKTIRIAKCDVEIVYHGVDNGASPLSASDHQMAHPDQYITFRVLQRKAYGSTTEMVSEDGEKFYGELEESKYVDKTDGHKSNEVLFNDTVHTPFSSYKETLPAKKESATKAQDLLFHIANSAYIDCSDN